MAEFDMKVDLVRDGVPKVVNLTVQYDDPEDVVIALAKVGDPDTGLLAQIAAYLLGWDDDDDDDDDLYDDGDGDDDA